MLAGETGVAGPSTSGSEELTVRVTFKNHDQVAVRVTGKRGTVTGIQPTGDRPLYYVSPAIVQQNWHSTEPADDPLISTRTYWAHELELIASS
jgi:hypothetical protein